MRGYITSNCPAGPADASSVWVVPGDLAELEGFPQEPIGPMECPHPAWYQAEGARMCMRHELPEGFSILVKCTELRALLPCLEGLALERYLEILDEAGVVVQLLEAEWRDARS